MNLYENIGRIDDANIDWNDFVGYNLQKALINFQDVWISVPNVNPKQNHIISEDDFAHINGKSYKVMKSGFLWPV